MCYMPRTTVGAYILSRKLNNPTEQTLFSLQKRNVQEFTCYFLKIIHSKLGSLSNFYNTQQ